MIISCRWLSKYIELPQDLEKLVQTLTFSGIEVEAVNPLTALPESVVSARVLSAEKIEGTDHLQVCSVDYGAEEPVQVVCGAPNCRAGMISVLATTGTALPGITLKKVKLHGVESNGMLCSERELGVSDNHAGIIELDPDTPLGVSVNDLYDLPDTILELEITPNRSDLLGYIGIARDLSASLGLPLRLPERKEVVGTESQFTAITLVLEDEVKCPRYTARLMDGVAVKESPQWLKSSLIKSGLRPINNIVDVTNYVMLETGHPLHAFDFSKLLPLNPSDSHPAIVVRKARPEEEFLALDGKTYNLDENDLVIADGKNPSALAGVIGGKASSITDATTSIVLEAATFSPMTVRSTSYNHKVSTDSSYRFERHLSAESPAAVSDRAIGLLLEVAGGTVCNNLYDAWPHPLKTQYLAIRPRRFKELIGYELSGDEIKAYLEALGCQYYQYGTWKDGLVEDPTEILCHHLEEEKAGKTEFSEIDCDHALYFVIPPYRVDLTREADLLEELARLAGYDRIPRKKTPPRIMDRHAHRIKRGIADHFTDAGFHEMLNYSFIDPAQLEALGYDPEGLKTQLISLINPQSSNQSAMRISLLPQLLENLRYNLHHGERNLKLMEMNKIYLKDGDSYREPMRLTALMTGKSGLDHWKAKADTLSVYHAKGLVEGLLAKLGLTQLETKEYGMSWLVSSGNLAYYHGGRFCASVGRIKSQVAESFGIDVTLLKQDVWMLDIDIDALVELTRNLNTVYTNIPRYPAVTRDISFVIETAVPYSSIEAAIRETDPELIREVGVFDEYRGKQVPEGFRSISLRIIVQDNEKTLTDERVDQVIASVLQKLRGTWQINMR
jgi:phenylalanyl-tRNA synthetase beta chain